MSMIEDLFRQSPFEPLRYHMKAVMDCVELVRPMFEAVHPTLDITSAGRHANAQSTVCSIQKPSRFQPDMQEEDERLGLVVARELR